MNWAQHACDDVLAVLLGGLLLVGTPAAVDALDPVQYYTPQPAPAVTVDIPKPLRHSNYSGGSCMYSSTATCLEWGGRSDLAAWSRSSYSGAAGISDIEAMLDRAEIPYESTSRGDAGVLERADESGRPAAIYYKVGHAITFLGLETKTRNGREFAVLTDNNFPGNDQFEWVPKGEFLRNWKNRFGGGAIVPLLDTPPAVPASPQFVEVTQ